MNPRCPLCRTPMCRLLFHNGTPDDLWECLDYCPGRPEVAIRVRLIRGQFVNNIVADIEET